MCVPQVGQRQGNTFPPQSIGTRTPAPQCGHRTGRREFKETAIINAHSGDEKINTASIGTSTPTTPPHDDWHQVWTAMGQWRKPGDRGPRFRKCAYCGPATDHAMSRKTPDAEQRMAISEDRTVSRLHMPKRRWSNR
jgi:hypothetical protein